MGAEKLNILCLLRSKWLLSKVIEKIRRLTDINAHPSLLSQPDRRLGLGRSNYVIINEGLSYISV